MELSIEGQRLLDTLRKYQVTFINFEMGEYFGKYGESTSLNLDSWYYEDSAGFPIWITELNGLTPWDMEAFIIEMNAMPKFVKSKLRYQWELPQ